MSVFSAKIFLINSTFSSEQIEKNSFNRADGGKYDPWYEREFFQYVDFVFITFCTYVVKKIDTESWLK